MNIRTKLAQGWLRFRAAIGWPDERINTTKGRMHPDRMEKRTGGIDNENESTTWVEYWHEGELVHRSAHIALKQGLFASGAAQPFGPSKEQ